MLIEVDDYDLSVLISGLGYENSKVIADYLEDCCCDGWNIKVWLGNSDIVCFDSSSEALTYMKENNLIDEKNCSVYSSINGVLIDLY